VIGIAHLMLAASVSLGVPVTIIDGGIRLGDSAFRLYWIPLSDAHRWEPPWRSMPPVQWLHANGFAQKVTGGRVELPPLPKKPSRDHLSNVIVAVHCGKLGYWVQRYGDESTNVEIEVRDPRALEIQVIDTAGDPAEGARILMSAGGSDFGFDKAMGLTDRRGLATIRHLDWLVATAGNIDGVGRGLAVRVDYPMLSARDSFLWPSQRIDAALLSSSDPKMLFSTPVMATLEVPVAQGSVKHAIVGVRVDVRRDESLKWGAREYRVVGSETLRIPIEASAEFRVFYKYRGSLEWEREPGTYKALPGRDGTIRVPLKGR